MYKKGFTPIFVAIAVLTLGLAVAGTFLVSNKIKPEVNTLSELPTEAEQIATASPLPNGTKTPIPTTKKTSVPTSPSTPSPSPKPTVDLSVLGPADTSIRYGYNKGDGKGWIWDSQVKASENATFNEVSPYWHASVSTCFQFKSSGSLNSQKVDYNVYYDGQLNASTSVDPGTYCLDFGNNVGTHTVKFEVNKDRKIEESNYENNSLEVSYELKADSTPPNFVISGPIQETEGTCVFINEVSDNVSAYSDITLEEKLDSNSYGPYTWPRLCINGTSGEQHTYWVKITDARGNTTEKSKSFQIF